MQQCQSIINSCHNRHNWIYNNTGKEKNNGVHVVVLYLSWFTFAKGWHVASLCKASLVPFITPYVLITCFAYSEQVGLYRQEDEVPVAACSRGEINIWYIHKKKRIICFILEFALILAQLRLLFVLKHCQ